MNSGAVAEVSGPIGEEVCYGCRIAQSTSRANPHHMLLSGSAILFFLGKRPSDVFYSCSEQRPWCWSFSLMFSKRFTYFLGCIGVLSIVLVIISIFGALFLVSRSFQ